MNVSKEELLKENTALRCLLIEACCRLEGSQVDLGPNLSLWCIGREQQLKSQPSAGKITIPDLTRPQTLDTPG